MRSAKSRCSPRASPPNTAASRAVSSTSSPRAAATMFAGSYRTTFTRPSWSKETPFESANNIERGKPTAANPFLNNKLSHFSELTGGGPLSKDRVWFFAAGALRELVDVRHDAGDGCALYEDQRQQALRRQADGHPAPEPHAAGQLHRQPRPSRERAGAVVQHRSGGADFAVDAQSAWRRQLQRRAARSACCCRRSTRRSDSRPRASAGRRPTSSIRRS